MTQDQSQGKRLTMAQIAKEVGVSGAYPTGD